MIASGI